MVERKLFRLACLYDEDAMTQPLTAVERRVYDYLLDFTSENTFQPSIRDIGRQLQIRSTKTVSDLLQSLAAKGFIERDGSRSRGVRLLGFSGIAGARPVPFYGRIHDGEPALLPENRDGYFAVERRFLPSDTTFMLRVRGDSMIGAGILDGDYVLIDPASEPAENGIVAVRIDECSALKRLTHEDSQIVLKAANPEVRDEQVPRGENVDILGVVCGVFRAFHDDGPPSARDQEQVTGDSTEEAPTANPVGSGVTPGTSNSLPQPSRPKLVS